METKLTVEKLLEDNANLLEQIRRRDAKIALMEEHELSEKGYMKNEPGRRIRPFSGATTRRK